MEGPGEAAAVRRRLYKDGYRDGGKSVAESALQEGFDAGFGEGAELGFRVGRLFGQARTLLEFHEANPAARVMDSSDERRIRHLLHTARAQLAAAEKKDWGDDLESLHVLVARVLAAAAAAPAEAAATVAAGAAGARETTLAAPAVATAEKAQPSPTPE